MGLPGQAAGTVASAFFAAVPGTTDRGTCAPPTSTGPPPSAGSTAADSALPGRFSEAKAYIMHLCRAGELLAGMDKATGGGDSSSGTKVVPLDEPPTLSDLGVSKKESSRSIWVKASVLLKKDKVAVRVDELMGAARKRRLLGPPESPGCLLELERVPVGKCRLPAPTMTAVKPAPKMRIHTAKQRVE